MLWRGPGSELLGGMLDETSRRCHGQSSFILQKSFSCFGDEVDRCVQNVNEREAARSA